MSTPAFRTGATVRKNKYAGTCPKCGQRVEPEQGSLEYENGQWVVAHVGPCPQAAPTAPPVSPDEADFSVPEGRYTITFASGHRKTIRVHRQDPDAAFMPGRVILSFLSGPSNDSDYTSFAHVVHGSVHVWKRFMGNAELREAVKVMLGDPKAASQAYAEASGTCSRCGRTLTVPSSLHWGYGPTCAKIVGIV